MNRQKLLFEMMLAAGMAGCSGSPQTAAPAAEPTTAPLASTVSAAGSATPVPGAEPPRVDAGRASSSETAISPPAPSTDAVPVGKAGEPAHNATKDNGAKSSTTAGGVRQPKSAASAATAATAAEPRAHAFECGEKGQKPCPLQGWMKANMASAAASGDANELAKQFDYVAGHAPPGLDNWATIAKSGATKAKAGDLDGAKGACKSCHDQYKAKYKAELRDRAF